MACMNLLNNEQQQQQHHHQSLYTTTAMSSTPRISFSNDFADPIKLENSYREAPVSSDFAFSVPNYSMISADELFSKGKMVPLRENCAKSNTLRDELLCGDDDDDDYLREASPRIAKGASRWRERLGLKRSYGVSKKCERKNDGSLESIDEMKIQDIVSEDVCDSFKGFL